MLRCDVYVCGPPSLTSALRKALRAAGLPTGQLHEERFSF
jgi:predicted ferric reductase